MLALADGRRLAYTDSGPRDGAPVIHCHGTPGSRHEPFAPSVPPVGPGLRLIAPDRPGYGDSTPHRERTLDSHAADVAALADHLGLETFALCGFSGGGPFALATAAVLGPRVRHVLLLASPAAPLLPDPIEHTGAVTGALWKLAGDDPRALIARLEPLTSDAESLAQTLRDALGARDRELLSTAACAEHFARMLGTAVRQGAGAAAAAITRDMQLGVAPWGFALTSVDQPVTVFHGTDDALLGTAHARCLADALPRATCEIRRGCEHYEVIYGAEAALAWDNLVPAAAGS